MITQNSSATQVQFATTIQTGPPARGHIRNRLRCAAQRALKGILQSTMNDSLRSQSLTAAKGSFFKQDCLIASAAYSIEYPKPGYAAAEYDDVS